MRKSLLVLGFSLAASTGSVNAQIPKIVARDGWEAFLSVEYRGGHAQFDSRVVNLALVLTDSTLGAYRCITGSCWAKDGDPIWKDPPLFVVRLDQITSVDASTSVRPASVGSKLLIGMLASDKREEFFGFAFESETSAEAPVFKTQATQAGALDAKIKFRLKKMGRPLPIAPDTTRSP